MGRLTEGVERVAALYRQAVAYAAAAEQALARPTAKARTDQSGLAQRLAAVGREVAPGWLGEPYDAARPIGDGRLPVYVRVGEARGEAPFPAVVPFVGVGHIAVDADARDERAAGLVRGVLLRTLAALPAGSLQVRVVDSAAVGATVAPFQALVAAGAMAPAVTDRAGLRGVLEEAERHVREGLAGGAKKPMLLVVASMPELTEPGDLARLSALAHAGPGAGLYLLVAGYAPPPTVESAPPAPALPNTTQITLRNPYALIVNPQLGEKGLAAPVYLDAGPPEAVLTKVCAQLAEQAIERTRIDLGDLMPTELWQTSSAAGLAATIGVADAPVQVNFDDATPHWMIGGRSGAGKTAFLINVLYGLCARYSPAELALYLLDFKEGVSFAEFTPGPLDPSWIPHARAVGIESDREYGVAVLRDLDREMVRRAAEFKRYGVTRFADLRAHRDLPRVVCVIDEFQVLFDGNDRITRDAVALLESLARRGRSYGIHLVLASQTVGGIEALYGKRDAIFGQFAIRVALPGGHGVLDPLNAAAENLPLGVAVLNTAGGTRGQDLSVRFPDPYAELPRLAELRHELWRCRPEENRAPSVFEGGAAQRIEDDPAYEATTPAARRKQVMVGRAVDVHLSTASFALDSSPGRHLAVLGPSEVGADVLAAAVRGLARQHEPGTVRFWLAPLVAVADAAADEVVQALGGHDVAVQDPQSLPGALAELAGGAGPPTYLVLFGADAAQLKPDALRRVLREGPARGVHVLGWWRGLRRFTEDIGGSSGREDVACLVFLNLPGSDVSLFLGTGVEWAPRPNRALLVDRHADRVSVIVPFSGGDDELGLERR